MGISKFAKNSHSPNPDLDPGKLFCPSQTGDSSTHLITSGNILAVARTSALAAKEGAELEVSKPYAQQFQEQILTEELLGPLSPTPPLKAIQIILQLETVHLHYPKLSQSLKATL